MGRVRTNFEYDLKTKEGRKKYYAEKYIREKKKFQARSKKYYEENKSAVKKMQAKWRKQNPDKLEKYRKNRAARIKKAFKLLEQLEAK